MPKKKEYKPIKWYIECKYCKYDFIRNIGLKCPKCGGLNDEGIDRNKKAANRGDDKS